MQTVEVHLGVDYRDLFMGVLMGMFMMGIVTVGVVFGLLKRLRYYEQLEAYDKGEDDEYARWEKEQQDGEIVPPQLDEHVTAGGTGGPLPTPGGEPEPTVAKPAPRKSSIKKIKTFVSTVSTKMEPAFTTVSTKLFNHRSPTDNFKPDAVRDDMSLGLGKASTERLSKKKEPSSPLEIGRTKTSPNMEMTFDMQDWVQERESSRSLTMPKVDRRASMELLK